MSVGETAVELTSLPEEQGDVLKTSKAVGGGISLNSALVRYMFLSALALGAVACGEEAPTELKPKVQMLEDGRVGFANEDGKIDYMKSISIFGSRYFVLMSKGRAFLLKKDLKDLREGQEAETIPLPYARIEALGKKRAKGYESIQISREILGSVQADEDSLRWKRIRGKTYLTFIADGKTYVSITSRSQLLTGNRKRGDMFPFVPLAMMQKTDRATRRKRKRARKKPVTKPGIDPDLNPTPSPKPRIIPAPQPKAEPKPRSGVEPDSRPRIVPESKAVVKSSPKKIRRDKPQERVKRGARAEAFTMETLPDQPNWFPKNVHITIDDGPRIYNGQFQQMLEVLSRYNVKATFFLVGNSIERQFTKNPERTRAWLERLIDDGHEIAYHSYYHRHIARKGKPRLDQENQEAVLADIARFKETLNKALGYAYDLRYGRMPGGSGTFKSWVIDAFKESGLEAPKFWRISGKKFYRGLYSEDSGLVRSLQAKKSDQIILLHEIPRDVKALRRLLHLLSQSSANQFNRHGTASVGEFSTEAAAL